MLQIVDLAARPHAGGGPVDVLIALLAFGLLPLLAVTMTSFTRIIVVLGLLRTAIGAPSLPPNIVLTALAMLLTGIVMAPTLESIRAEAIGPYSDHRVSPSVAVERAAVPLRRFMSRQVRASDVEAFSKMAGSKNGTIASAPLSAITAAFLVDELRAAFAMGFALSLPFAVIDIVVAGVLMSLGMYMVSPTAIALPLKLLLFVIADGWAVVAGALVASYR